MLSLNATVHQFNCTTLWHSFQNQYQVVIPQSVLQKISIKVGDLLEAKAERGRIIFTSKSVVDRGVAVSLADFKAGHFQ